MSALTHFDAAGNAVSSTQTVNYLFGSGVIAEGTGQVSVGVAALTAKVTGVEALE